MRLGRQRATAGEVQVLCVGSYGGRHERGGFTSRRAAAAQMIWRRGGEGESDNRRRRVLRDMVGLDAARLPSHIAAQGRRDGWVEWRERGCRVLVKLAAIGPEPNRIEQARAPLHRCHTRLTFTTTPSLPHACLRYCLP